MKTYHLNDSRYGMWVNEIAFPDEAINTIAIRMYFPDCDVQSLCSAVDTVIASSGIFRVKLKAVENGEPLFEENMEVVQRCTIRKVMRREDAEAYCTDLESQKIYFYPDGKLYDAQVWPVAEGGSLLSFRFHHILLDGFSMCQTAQRILDVLAGKALSYLAFDLEQEQKEPREDETQEKKFWAEYFSEIQSESSIFAESVSGCRRTCYTYSLTEGFSEKMDAFAHSKGITPASVFAGAFSIYLSRAAQTEDAVFLMPRLNRETEEERDHMGCYTMVVPVRVTVKEEMNFEELCKLALTQSRAASKHKKYGFSNILTDLHNAGVLAGAISEYTLNFYQPKLESSIPFEIRLSMDGGMHNHLTANITRLKDCYEIIYDGRDGIYTEERVRWFHEGIMAILEQGMQTDVPVEEIDIIGNNEKAKLEKMKGKTVDVSSTATIPSLFRCAAEKYGDRPALYAGKASYSFRELDKVSNRVANGLLSRGIGQGEPVMFMLNRDYRLIPVMLGILKAGAAFIPVDPQYPKGRVDYILENSGAAYLISSASVTAANGHRYLEAEELLDFSDETDPCLAIPQEQLAYCIYTSGTTGNPKGVMLTHKGIVNITDKDNNPFNRDIVKCGTGIVAIGSICFDISLFEIFVPLLNGMFIELAPEKALADSAAIAELLSAHGANMLHCTPSRLSIYLNEKNFAAALRNVRVILAAGEVLPGQLVDELRQNYGIRIYNGYGPTETTIGATITEAGDNQTIGKPIANTGIMILDKKGRRLPLGAVGEICVYGNGVGMGYRGLPKETESRFVELYGKRTYRTGDLGAFQADGRILYRGRNDNQVKIRGLRIELTEIENCMRSFEGVGAAKVMVRVLAGSQHLVGFYTVKDGSRIDGDALKAHLKNHLTLYMVPDILKMLSAIPQTPGGKTDLKALAEEPVEYTRIYRKPENSFQKAICEAFQAVLGEEQIGLYDHFFELGGDSLHTAELISEIEIRLPGAEIDFEDIFKYPTPELLAQHLYRPSENKKYDNPLKKLDYHGIGEYLAKSRFASPKSSHLGNILLTGTTGFLGIHILLELLAHPEKWDKLYCLTRPTRRLNVEKRISSTLFYFGEHDYGEYFGERLFALEGDIAKEDIFAEPFEEKIDTVINCAANVAHFAYDDKLDRINTGGVRNLLEFCKKQGAELVQISTISVGGVYPAEAEPHVLTEEDFFIGQEIHNQYILSKYMAEYAALRAAVDDGTAVKIMRVGNLQGRIADGEFQMNRKTNAFTRQLSSYVKIGKAPQSLYEKTVNFSPVDEVARMIVALCGLPREYCVFHVYPPQEVPFMSLFSALEKVGHPVERISDEEFDKYIRQLGQTKDGKALTEGILLERPNLQYRDCMVTEQFTRQTLKSLGKEWKSVDRQYLSKYFTALEDMLMFD